MLEGFGEVDGRDVCGEGEGPCVQRVAAGVVAKRTVARRAYVVV